MKQGMQYRLTGRSYWLEVNIVSSSAAERAAARRMIGPFASEDAARAAARDLGQQGRPRYRVAQVPERHRHLPKRWGARPLLAPDYVAAVGLVAAMKQTTIMEHSND